MVGHPLEGHHLAYAVIAGDMILHSELVPGRQVLEFPSFEVPPHIRQVEIMITHYGRDGEHIGMVRRTLHPIAIKAALNSIPWRMLEEYLLSIQGKG